MYCYLHFWHELIFFNEYVLNICYQQKYHIIRVIIVCCVTKLF